MPRTKSDDGRKPLSLPVIHILLALAGGARHGYAIKQDVEERTGGAVRLGPGTLYEALQRLQDGGLIDEGRLEGEDPVNGQEAQRRYYTLTDRGWTALRLEVQQLGSIVDRARALPKLRKGLV